MFTIGEGLSAIICEMLAKSLIITKKVQIPVFSSQCSCYNIHLFPSTVFWEKNRNGWVHNIESVTKLLKCNVFAQVIYKKIGNFLYFSIFFNMHPKFLIILEILTTKMAQKRAQKVQKIAEPRGFRSRILHCSA